MLVSRRNALFDPFHSSTARSDGPDALVRKRMTSRCSRGSATLADGIWSFACSVTSANASPRNRRPPPTSSTATRVPRALNAPPGMFTLTFWAHRGELATSIAMVKSAADLMRR